MSVSYPQRWRLRRIDRWMARSDPHLATMLSIFARLAADEPIVSVVQAGFRHTGLWYNLSRMKAAALLLIAYVSRALCCLGRAVICPRPGWERSWLGLGAGHVRSQADEKYG